MAISIDELKQKRLGNEQIAALKPKEQVKYLLEQNSAFLRSALPKHLSAERLMKVAQTAATTTPGLLECYVPTLIGAVVQCAQMGLEPNTVLGHAYLVPFKNRDKKRKDVQVIVGYKGLIDLARRSGQIESIAAHAVRAGDHFEFAYGLNEKLEHKPPLDTAERGDIIAFYAVAHMKDGGHAFEVMSRAQVDAIMRNTQSKGEYGPWKNHYEEMGRKTVARRLCKWLPLSVELATATVLDERAEDGRAQDLDGVLEGEYSIPTDDAETAAEGSPAKADATTGGAESGAPYTAEQLLADIATAKSVDGVNQLLDVGRDIEGVDKKALNKAAKARIAEITQAARNDDEGLVLE